MFRKNLPQNFRPAQRPFQPLDRSRVIFPQSNRVVIPVVKPNALKSPNTTNAKVSSLNPLSPVRPKSRKWKRFFLKFGIILLILVVLGTLGFAAYQSQFWIIEKVEFNSDWPSLPGLADQLSQEYQGKNMLTLNTSQKVTELLQNPNIKSAYIQKKIPHILYIFIQEARPVTALITLNKLQLLDSDGVVIKEVNATKPLQIGESERLLYVTPRVFRNNLLLTKWESTQEAKLQQDYAVYLQAAKASAPPATTTPVATNTPGSAAQPSPSASPSTIYTYEQFVAQRFSEQKLTDLNQLYQILRNEVKFAIDGNWQELSAQISDLNLPVIYSLVDRNELSDDYLLSDQSARVQFQVELTKRFNWQRIEIISPVLMRVPITGMTDNSDLANQNAEVYFNLEKDQTLNFKKLNTLLADLQSKKQHFTKIDLSGEKVVLS